MPMTSVASTGMWASARLKRWPRAVLVLLVDLEVLGEVVDAAGEQRDLHLGRAGVGLVEPVLGDDLGLLAIDDL